MSKKAVCTIIAKNYLAHARVLMDSVRRWDPDCLRIVILVDQVDGCFDPFGEDFEVIRSEDLGLPQSKWFHFKYTILELSTAVKPFALEFLIHRFDLDQVAYLDPDIKLYGPLTQVWNSLENNAIVLTPHLTSTLDDGFRPTDLDILRSGTYNLGFVAVQRTPETFRMLKWWQARLYDHCVVDLPRGLFVDQRWMDLVPGMFSGVCIHRDPGLNVAYWNLAHRKIDRVDGTYTVNGQPLCFFHFSGFDPENPDEFSRHQNRFRLNDLDKARDLVIDYRDDLFRHGYSQSKKWPYAYGFFKNGLAIPEIARPIHHESEEIRQIEDPFSEEGFRAFVDVWNQPIVNPGGETSGISRLSYRIYRTRSDVQAVMPDIFGGDRLRFLEWVLTSGKAEHHIDAPFLSPVWDALRAARHHQNGHAPAASRVPVIGGLPVKPGIGPAVFLKPGSHRDVPIESLNELIENGGSGLRLTRLARIIYEMRPELQRFFPDPCGRDAVKFLVWILTYGRKEHRLDEPYLAPLRAQWQSVLDGLDGFPTRVWYRSLLAGMSVSVAVRSFVSTTLTRIEFARSQARFGSAQPKGKPAAERQFADSGHHSTNGHHAGDRVLVAGPTGLNLVGYVTAETGVGESVRAAALAARSVGLPVALRKIRPAGPERTDDHSAGSLSDSFPHPFNVFHVNADETPKVFTELEEPFLARKYNIGYWAWELEEFPDRFLPSFAYLDEVWTPSAFCHASISQKSPIPVTVVPHAIDIRANTSTRRADFGLPDGQFLFLTVFDMLSVFERKNPLAVISAFTRAFGGRGNCHLVIKVNHAQHRPDHMRRMSQAAAGHQITIIDRTFSHSDVYGLISSCDCLVSLHRAEGFGLSLAEAMYLGQPVIATEYSGNLDFTLPETSFLVRSKLTRVGLGCQPYDENSYWADPDVDEAARVMRVVATNAEQRRKVAAFGQAFVRSHFSPESVGAQIKARLEAIRVPTERSERPAVRPLQEKVAAAYR